MQISAAVTRSANAPFTLEQIEIDAPRDDEVLVRIVGVGLCHTDLVGAAGAFPLKFPAVMGHEGSGVVEQIGSKVTKVQCGDHVVLSMMSCGACPNCDAHFPGNCYTGPALNYLGTRSDGSKTLRDASGDISGSFFGQSSFGSHALANQRNVIKIDKDAPLEIMGALGCGIQTGAGSIMRAMGCHKGSSLVILGGGTVGLAAAMGAVVQGCATIIVVEPMASRREMALTLGATHVIDPLNEDTKDAVLKIVPAGVQYIFDNTAMPKVVDQVCRYLAPRGVFGFVGIPKPEDLGMKLPGAMVMAMQNGYTFKGIIEGDSDPDVFIPQLVELHKAGRLPFDKLIKKYPLAEINRAVDEQHRGLCIKPVLLT